MCTEETQFCPCTATCQSLCVQQAAEHRNKQQLKRCLAAAPIHASNDTSIISYPTRLHVKLAACGGKTCRITLKQAWQLLKVGAVPCLGSGVLQGAGTAVLFALYAGPGAQAQVGQLRSPVLRQEDVLAFQVLHRPQGLRQPWAGRRHQSQGAQLSQPSQPPWGTPGEQHRVHACRRGLARQTGQSAGPCMHHKDELAAAAACPGPVSCVRGCFKVLHASSIQIQTVRLQAHPHSWGGLVAAQAWSLSGTAMHYSGPYRTDL